MREASASEPLQKCQLFALEYSPKRKVAPKGNRLFPFPDPECLPALGSRSVHEEKTASIGTVRWYQLDPIQRKLSRSGERKMQLQSWQPKHVCRAIAALLLLMTSSAGSWAQEGLSPSIWKSERGAILKVLTFDIASGNFGGVFISSPAGPCQAVAYDLLGRFRGHRVGFRTSRTWTSDCSVTAVWSGRFVSPTTVTTRWTARYVAPNGHVTRRRGTEVFQRI